MEEIVKELGGSVQTGAVSVIALAMHMVYMPDILNR